MSKKDEPFTITGEWLDARLVESMHAHTAATLEDWSTLLQQESGRLWASNRPASTAVAEYLRDTLVPLMKNGARDARAKQMSAQAEADKIDHRKK